MRHPLSSPSTFERDPLAQSHCKCTLLAHVVWSTDRRTAVLGHRFEPWLRDMMTAKAFEAGSRLLGFGVADPRLKPGAWVAALSFHSDAGSHRAAAQGGVEL